jgi:NAD(P)-dependent dehydrogenase (short-subunit alcohol dehydrogenase family)
MRRTPFDDELDAARAAWRYRPPTTLLGGRTILVTGAGAGLGAAAARTFARYGANVVLLGRTQRALEDVHDDIANATATDPTIVPCDLARVDAAALTLLAGQLIDHYGALDGLLHSAGTLGPRVPIEHYAPLEWDAVMRVNLTAPFLLTRVLLPALRAAPDASVVFTSSSVGRRARAYWGAYAVSKFGVEALSQILADEHDGTFPVRFNTLNPGATRTAMRAAAYPAESPATVAPPESKMDIYLYLLGPDSGNVNGQQLDAREWPGA